MVLPYGLINTDNLWQFPTFSAMRLDIELYEVHQVGENFFPLILLLCSLKIEERVMPFNRGHIFPYLHFAQKMSLAFNIFFHCKVNNHHGWIREFIIVSAPLWVQFKGTKYNWRNTIPPQRQEHLLGFWRIGTTYLSLLSRSACYTLGRKVSTWWLVSYNF